MMSLGPELWSLILSFLYKAPPGAGQADPLLERWEDYSQDDLARCMRVSSVSDAAGNQTRHIASY